MKYTYQITRCGTRFGWRSTDENGRTFDSMCVFETPERAEQSAIAMAEYDAQKDTPEVLYYVVTP